MLPPGHIAGGYLTALVVIKVTGAQLNPQQTASLLALGAFAGFAPDLDFFYAFYKVRSFTIQENKVNHRHYITHAPLVWLVTGLLIYFFGPTDFIKLAGLTVWLGGWSHFVLDSIQHGIMWLWPLSTKRYALLKAGGTSKGIIEPNFFKFWFKAVMQYPKELPYTFTLEILIIITALFFLLTNHY